MRIVGCVLFVFLLMHINVNVIAQPGTTIELKKPAKYETRTLRSEKTTEGKLGKTKKFFQNTFTHYNYYFNARTRLGQIIDRAKLSYKDDYTKLLAYYDYPLDITSIDTDLDSVIYKCNTGILLHDLRNDWIDDLYFTMGKAYYLRKNFDSAEHVFLYINYAFAKKDEGYDIPIGSNAAGNVFTVSTKEKTGLAGRLSMQPRRNEDLIWVAKNYIDEGKIGEAAGILEILRSDPFFPERLQPELNETFGYLFYQQKSYDSAAVHLSLATDMDDDKQEKARREFLTGQLYALAGENKDAEKYFARSADHAVDPIMEIYANLNAIDASDDSSNTASKKIAALLHLAQKDKFVGYRDMIYYAAAKADIEQKNYADAYGFLKKSVKYNVDNPAQRSLSFMLLGDLSYDKPDYVAAKNYYDSVTAASLPSAADQQRLTERLAALQVIASNITIIHTEDSLQTVAKMPETQRVALIKKLVRALRKAQGLKESDTSVFINPAVAFSGAGNNPAVNNTLFGAPGSAAKGDWYFNNTSLRASGLQSFHAAWGNRPNVDNWQRIDAINKQQQQSQQQMAAGTDPDHVIDTSLENNNSFGNINDANPDQPKYTAGNGEISFDALLDNVPLTDDKLKASDSRIIEALFANAKEFQNELEDYDAAIADYDTLIKRYPANPHLEASLAGLFYCYTRLGRKASADSALNVINTKFKNGTYAKLLNNIPSNNARNTSADSATAAYENIYDLFIEGNFEQAKADKAKADSMYGNSHWTPQLLYIESIYYVSKRDDSTAINKLTALNTQFAGSPLSTKAETMIDVLKRRRQIETYLTNLKVTRLPEDEPSPVVNLTPVQNVYEQREIKRDSTVSSQVQKAAQQKTDTIKAITGAAKTYVFNASDSQFVGILLNKVDPVYANETRNAFNRYNQINVYNQKINITSAKLNDSLNLVLLGPFSDAAAALIYVDKVKPQAGGTIIPWLKPDKYSFTIISQPNLKVMNDTKDVEGYKILIQKVLPGKF